MIKSLAIIVSLVSGSISALAADDPYLNVPQLSAQKFYSRCSRPSLAQYEKAGCLSDVVKGLRTTMKAAIASRVVYIEAIANDQPIPGALAGKEVSAQWKSEFIASQSKWEEYNSKQCDNEVKFDHYGGNGAAIYGAAREVRHLAARINEIGR